MNPVIFVGLIALVAAGITAYAAHKQRTRVRRMEDTPTSSIAELRPGFREIKGRAGATDRMLTSPLSNRACVFYELKVEQQSSHHNRKGHHHSHWRTIVKDRQAAACVVDDGTGSCPVDLLNAELFFKTDTHLRSGFLNDAPAHVEEMLQTRYGKSSQGLIFNKTMRYTETVIVEGDMLYVLGTASGTRVSGLRIGKGDDVFIVSDQSEGALTHRFGTRAIGYTVAAAVLGIGGFVALVAGAMGFGFPAGRRRH